MFTLTPIILSYFGKKISCFPKRFKVNIDSEILETLQDVNLSKDVSKLILNKTKCKPLIKIENVTQNLKSSKININRHAYFSYPFLLFNV